MLSLKQCLKDILGAVQDLTARKNTYYTASATKANVPGTSFTLCSVALPKGLYLVLGNVEANTGSATDIIGSFLSYSGSGQYVARGNGRTTMDAGGGCQSWGILNVTGSSATAILTTYGYYSYSCNYIGRMAAIKLI